MDKILNLFNEIKKELTAIAPDSNERKTALAFLQTALMWCVKVIQYPEQKN